MEQAATEEKDRAQDEVVKKQVNNMVTEETSDPGNRAKIKELSSRLGIAAESTDYKLSTKTEIAKVFLERAIKAGKSQDEIKSALTS